MCGVVGYIGDKEASNILIKGLKRLEYRGYDSSGISILNKSVTTIKSFGKISNLEKKLQKTQFEGKIGIGHTRWATHGAPSDINSHPHSSSDSLVTVVHNGIIENYYLLKEELLKKGYTFKSETDTEVIANYLSDKYKESNCMIDALANLHKEAIGSYALAVIVGTEPFLYAAKRQSPLVIGIGEGENFIASDVAAVLEYTKNYYILEEDEIVALNENVIKIFDKDKKQINKNVFVVNWDISAAEKGGYSHFMLKEIYEQPKAVKETISPRIINNEIELGIQIDPTQISKIHIVACGSASYAGTIGKNVIESLARIPCEVYIASEFRYQNPILNENDLVIIISQSGETADTLAALRHAKNANIPVLAIVNVLGSSIARESDYSLFTWAGPEIAVATTKAYSAQVVLQYLIAIKFALEKGTIDRTKHNYLINELFMLPQKVEQLLQDKYINQIKVLANKYAKLPNAFLIGRGIDYAAVMEGSLKLKEISYMQSEAYAAGELKHGTISLIEDGTLVIAVATQKHVSEKTISNLQEVKSRGASTIIIVAEGYELLSSGADHTIVIPAVEDIFSATLTAIPMQLFAYYVGVERDCDIDMPRNLAKSVTVE